MYALIAFFKFSDVILVYWSSMADLVDQNLEDSLMESKGCDDEKEEQFGNDETRQLDVKTFVNSTCAWEESQLFVHNNENHVNSFDHGKSSLNAESECSEDVPLDYMTQNAMSTICCLSQTECMPTDEFKIKMLFKSQRDEPPKQDKISIGRFSPNNNSRQQTIDVRNPSSQNKGYESHPCDNSILEISSKQSMEETIVDDIVLCCDRLNDLAVSGGVCSPLHLDDLPVEVLMYIFSFLDARFILRTLSKVCQLFHDLFSGDMYWKNRISKKWSKRYPPVQSEYVHICVNRG